MLTARMCVSIAALALVLAACSGAAEAPAVQQAAPLVEVVAAAPADSAGAVRASGLVAYKRETVLSFNTPGVIAALNVDEGDSVRRGQTLATLRRVSVGANADEAALTRETAERNLRRAETLYESGYLSQAALDDARLAVSRASAGSSLSAPAAGIILRRSAEPAQMVNAGQPVLVLGDVGSGIIVRASVSAREAQRVKVNDAVRVRIAGLEERTGQVARVGAKSDDATGAFEIEVRLENAEGLRSGQVAEVVIEGEAPAEARAALLIPTMALLDARADQAVVYIVDAQNIARRRAVETAGLMDGGVLVVAGLEPGERIVAAGAAYVRDGEPVRVHDAMRGRGS